MRKCLKIDIDTNSSIRLKIRICSEKRDLTRNVLCKFFKLGLDLNINTLEKVFVICFIDIILNDP